MGIDSIGNQTTLAAPQNTATQSVKEAPAALRGAHTSTIKFAARVVASLLTGGLSEGFIALAKGVKGAIADHTRTKEVRAQTLAQANVDASNHQLAKSIKSGDGLSPAFQAAVNEGLEEIQESFNGMGLESTTELSSSARATLAYTIRTCGEETTPEQLKDLVIQNVRPEAAKNVLTSHIQQFMDDENITAIGPKDLDALKNPDLQGLQSRLAECENADDVNALYAEFKAPLESSFKFHDAATTAWQDVRTEANATLAQRTGLSLDTIASSQALRTLTREATPIFQDLISKNTFPDVDQVKTSFQDIFTAQLAAKDAMFESIQDLPVSDELKQQFKVDIFCNAKYAGNADIFTKAAEAVKNVDTTSLTAAAQMPQGSMDSSEIADLFKSLGTQLHENFTAAYGDGLEQLSKEQLSTAKDVVGKMLFDQHPNLVEAFRAQPDTLTDMRLEQRENMHMNNWLGHGSIDSTVLPAYEFVYSLDETQQSANEINTQFIAQLGKPEFVESTVIMQAKEACTAALNDVRANFGEDSVPAGNTIEEFMANPDGKAITDALATAIKAADHPLTPQDVHDMLYVAVQSKVIEPVAIDTIVALGQETGTPTDKFHAGAILKTLHARLPELNTLLATATSPEMAADMVRELPDVQAMLQLNADLTASRERVFDALTNALATALNVTPESLKEDFDPSTVISGTVHSISEAIQENVAKPNTAIPNAAQILERYTDKIQSIVDKKMSLIDTLPNLRGVENRQLSDDAQASLRRQLLVNTSVDTPEMIHYFANIAARLDASACINAVNAGDMDTAIKDLKAFSASMTTTAHQVIPHDVYEAMDSDAMASIGAFVRTILFDTNPSLHQAFTNNKELLRDMRTNIEAESRMITRAQSKSGRSEQVQQVLAQRWIENMQVLSVLNHILEN